MKTILLRSPRYPSDPFLDRAEISAENAAASEQAAAESQEAAQQSASGSAQSSQLADEARVKAETAQGKAETAQEASELAQGKAEAAQQAAELAQSKAEPAKEAAEVAQGKAETAQGNAEQSEESARRSATQAAEDAAVILAETSKAIDASHAAQSAKSEAVRAKEDATAIVYDGEYSQTPKAGSVAVADSKGHLDIGWTPLLQAMYPYSGLIGNLDKNKVFFLPGAVDVAYSDRIDTGVGGREITANIAGRFVQIKDSHTVIRLSAAESTADRAIAFDDIFLDWNGNVQTYRSITPYPVGASHDRDAIATEHGYSKINTGLYKTGDTYALLLGRIARRNWGIYHPQFNPEGSGSARSKTQDNGYHFWFDSRMVKLTSKEDAFDPDIKSTVNAGASGAIGAYGNVRPDQKYYDAIYADDFTPLYYSAKNVVDRQALLFDSYNRAVAGETFSGAEATTELPYMTASSTASSGILPVRMSYGHKQGENFKEPETVNIFNVTKNEIVNGARLRHKYEVSPQSELSGFSQRIDTSDVLIILNPEDTLYPERYPKKSAARPQFLMVDIIGALDAMPDEWKTHGIPGNWLAVGEEGESLIPDGTRKNFKLSRKCLECYQVLYSSDKGVSWVDDTPGSKEGFESASNGRELAQAPNGVRMVFYRTSANPFELADNAVVNLLGNEVFATKAAGNYEISAGCALVSKLINKIPTLGFGGTAGYRDIKLRFLLNKRNELTSGFSEQEQWHDAFNIAPAHQTPGCKMLPYLTNSNDRYCLQIMYQEIKSNGTTSGDDLHFRIVDKQTTYTDLNGASCIVGQKKLETFFQFDGVTY